MSPDPYAHFDAAYVLGALEPDERSAFEAHLATCMTCRGRVDAIAGIPAMLAGLDESAFGDDLDTAVGAGIRSVAAAGPGIEGIDSFGSPRDVDAGPVPDTLLPGLLRKARRERVRRRVVTGGLGAVAAACLVALLVLVWPGSTSTPATHPMTAVAASPVEATVALQPEKWGTKVQVTCWYRSDAQVTTDYEYALVAYDVHGQAYQLGNWQLMPGHKISYTSGTALSPDQIRSLKIVMPDGTPILAFTT